jgi:predicted nucleic acid-binding protein
MELYVDASALVALGHEPDRHHKAAVAYSADIPAEVVRVASDYVFGESVTVLQRLSGHRVAVRAGQALRASSNWRWVKVTEADFEEAWALFERNKDDLSFNDCTIVAQMRRLGIESIFTFDQAFRKAGVKVVPGKA